MNVYFQWIPLLLILLLGIYSCSIPNERGKNECFEGEGIAIFLGSFFPYNTSMSLVINDGEYTLNKYFPLGMEKDDLTCLTNHTSSNDSIKIYLRINKLDTVMYLNKKIHKKVFIGATLDRRPIISIDFDFWNPSF